MAKQIIHTDAAPAPIGPYSQATVANGIVFTAGQVGLDTAGTMATGIDGQTRQALINIKAVLEAAGSSMENVLKMTIYLQHMNDFSAMNKVYAEFFTDDPPARSAFQVAKLPVDAMIEIEAVAVVG
jgi:2-iminobutanoate/2-iminopropanoate deaminase